MFDVLQCEFCVFPRLSRAIERLCWTHRAGVCDRAGRADVDF